MRNRKTREGEVILYARKRGCSCVSIQGRYPKRTQERTKNKLKCVCEREREKGIHGSERK